MRVPRYAGVVGGELDNGRQKTRNHGYDVIVGELFTDYSDHPQTCHAKPKTQINRRRTRFFSCCDAYRKQLGLKDFSPKSQDAGIAAD